MPPLRIVIIDDHPVYRAGLRAVLSRDEFEVVAEAGDALAGFAAVESTQPDMVLVDESLPGADGITAARELLRRDPNRRVMVVSMNADESAAADALEAGARGYFGKDQPIEDLRRAVRAVAEGHRYLPPALSARAIETRLRRGRNGPLGLLSRREREVFELLVRGFTNELVASHLRISRRTVETHRSRILKKLHVHSAVELIRLAVRHGLL